MRPVRHAVTGTVSALRTASGIGVVNRLRFARNEGICCSGSDSVRRPGYRVAATRWPPEVTSRRIPARVRRARQPGPPRRSAVRASPQCGLDVAWRTTTNGTSPGPPWEVQPRISVAVSADGAVRPPAYTRSRCAARPDGTRASQRERERSVRCGSAPFDEGCRFLGLRDRLLGLVRGHAGADRQGIETFTCRPASMPYYREHGVHGGSPRARLADRGRGGRTRGYKAARAGAGARAAGAPRVDGGGWCACHDRQLGADG